MVKCEIVLVKCSNGTATAGCKTHDQGRYLSWFLPDGKKPSMCPIAAESADMAEALRLIRQIAGPDPKGLLLRRITNIAAAALRAAEEEECPRQ